MMDTLPLDLNSLLAEMNNDKEQINSAKAFPSGARIGHIHLRVTNIERSIEFYHRKDWAKYNIGLELDGCCIPFCRWVSSSHRGEYLASA